MPPQAPRLPADAVASAVERIVRFRGQRIVVKLGGSAMEEPAATRACLQSIATLHHLRIPVVLVHGGGKPIDRAMAEAGLTPRKVAGRRYTDEQTLAIVVRVLRDEINAAIVKDLQALGCAACAAAEFLHGEPLTLPGPDSRPIDLGRVGRVTQVDSIALTRQLDEGLLPVIPSLALDANTPAGGWLNVNADTAASAVAGVLKASQAIFLTDTLGVLRDRHDPHTLIANLTERDCRALIASGVIDGGMTPKVEACFEALAAGAASALILDGRIPFSLLDVFLQDSFTGTAIIR